jgi:hypothetical protein
VLACHNPVQPDEVAAGKPLLTALRPAPPPASVDGETP